MFRITGSHKKFDIEHRIELFYIIHSTLFKALHDNSPSVGLRVNPNKCIAWRPNLHAKWPTAVAFKGGFGIRT